MQRKSIFASLTTLGFCAAIALSASSVQAQNATGTWKWTTPGRNGGEGQEMTLKLKADSDKLTGSLTRPGRNGGDPVETPISDGKIAGSQINFNVVMDFNGNSMTNKYEGKIDGDTIKGTQTGPARRGRRQGGGGNAGGGGDQGGGNTPPPAPQPREWTATRAK